MSSSRCTKCGRSLPGTKADDDSETFEQSALICEACLDLTRNTTSINCEHAETATLPLSRGMGNRIAHYLLVRTLGSGSFGDVWLAEDARLDRLVALKIPGGNRPGAAALFYEAKTAASLRHTHIVAVYEVGEDNGQPYIATEFIDGVTLRDYLSTGRPPLQRVIELLIPISEALQFAHAHGVVHRDVKPANILVDQAGVPYVTDFGLAKRLTVEETISSSGQVVGTVRYMSPEQASGNTVETDARSDIYSIGVMMFEMLTGEPPYRGNVRAVLQQKVKDDAPSLRLLDPTIPRDIETICLKCLEREPSRRFESAKLLRDELKRFADGEPIHSRPIGRMERGWRWCKKRPAVSSLGLALFLSLVSGLFGVSYFGRQSARNASEAKRMLYRSWMNLAAHHLESGSPAGVRELLGRVSTDPVLAASRGFEFGYFTNMVSPIEPVGSVGDSVVDVAITHDGNTGAATNGGQTIHVWNTSNGKLLRTLHANQDGFTEIDFSSANSCLVAGSVDGHLRVYEPLISDRMIRQVKHGPPVLFASFSPDGQFLIAAGKTGALRIWDSDTGELIVEVPTGKGETRAVRFSPDSKRLYVARDDGRIREWSISDLLATGPNKIPIPKSEFDVGPAPVAMSVSDNGEQLVVAFYNGGILIHDLTDDAGSSLVSVTHNVNLGLIQDVEHVAGTWSVAITTSTGSLYLFDTKFQREVRLVKSHAATGQLSRSGNGKVLLLGSGDGNVSKLESHNLLRPTVLWNQAPVRSLAFVGPQELIATNEQGEVALWNLATGQHEGFDSTTSLPTMLVAVDSARRLIATAGSRSGIEIRELPGLNPVAELSTPDAGVSAMRFSPSGELLVVAIRKGPLRLYASDNWQQPRFETTHEQLIPSVAVSLDNRFIAVAHSSGTVELLDSSSGQTLNTISLELDEPSVVEFCQDGDTLAIGTNGGAILFYDLPTRTVKAQRKWHTGRINALAVLPGSQMIVSAGRDRHLNLWDLRSGDLVTQLIGHFRQVFTIAASEDGKTIVSGGLGGDIRVWRSE